MQQSSDSQADSQTFQSLEEAAAKAGLNGHFRIHSDFASAHLAHARHIQVWLPPGYESAAERYPVLYMHDGNNLFDAGTAFGGSEWQVDENMHRLLAEERCQELIIVGIYNSVAREDEYTWTPRQQEDGSTIGGQGPAYARFLVEELKPFIDATYRTQPGRDDTAVAGSSLGGLISFYLGRHYPQVFSRIGILSPSLWWNDGEPIRDAAEIGQDLLLWVDMGMREGSQPTAAITRVKDFVRQLETRGYVRGENLAYRLEVDAGHNETAWSQRVDEMICYFFGR
ncbi:MAG TPA: alpha/beta hydrolase-fold protein [Candidatus Obscuribacterales bacterium]